MSVLTVVTDDRGAAVRSSEALSFGRAASATLKLDLHRADGSLSRIAGVFQALEDGWHIVNTSSRARIEVSVDGGLAAVLAPGASPLALLTPCAGSLRVHTTQCYLIEFTVAGAPSAIALPDPEGETTTAKVADALELTAVERRVLAGLAEPRLRHPGAGAWRVATTAELQRRLEFSTKQIEAAINGIAIKLAPYLGGLIGSNAGRANTRRHQIVGLCAAGRLRRLARLARSLGRSLPDGPMPCPATGSVSGVDATALVRGYV